MTSTPFTTRLVTRPSITASCMITPIRRVLFRLHSRELRALHVLVHVPLHAPQAMPGPRHPERAPMAQSGDALPVDTAGMLSAHELASSGPQFAAVGRSLTCAGTRQPRRLLPDGYGQACALLRSWPSAYVRARVKAMVLAAQRVTRSEPG